MPVSCAAGKVPRRLLELVANSAYGTGNSAWRGHKIVNALVLPLVRTPMASQ